MSTCLSLLMSTCLSQILSLAFLTARFPKPPLKSLPGHWASFLRKPKPRDTQNFAVIKDFKWTPHWFTRKKSSCPYLPYSSPPSSMAETPSIPYLLILLLLSVVQPSQPMDNIVMDGLVEWEGTTVQVGDSLCECTTIPTSPICPISISFSAN